MNSNEQLITRYTNELEVNRKSQEIRRIYKYVLSNLENHVQKPFNDMTKEDIMDFFNAVKTGKIKGRDKPYSDYSIELFKVIIKTFYKWLYDFKTTQKIPEQVAWIEMDFKKAYKHKTEADILSEKEIDQLINTAKNLRDRTVIAVLYDPAFRIGEFTKSLLAM